MVARHRTPILTGGSSSRSRNRRTSAPSNARLLEPPPTRRRHGPRQNPNITKHPTYNSGTFHRPTRNTIKTVPSLLRRDLADIVVRPCFPFRVLLRGVPEQNPLGLGGRSLTPESSEGGFLLLMTTVVVLVFADFVLSCRVGEDCAVGIWQAKEPF